MTLSPERSLAWIKGLGGQRFILTCGFGFVATLLLVFHFIDPGTWLTAIGGTVVVFIGSGTYQDVVKSKQPTG